MKINNATKTKNYFSEKVHITMTPEMKDRICAEASKHNMTLSAFVREILSQVLDEGIEEGE